MNKFQKVTFGILGIALVGLLIRGYFIEKSLGNKLIDLHNQVARTTKTVEVFAQAFQKKTVQSKDLDDALKAIQKQADHDSEVIKSLRGLIKERDEDIVLASRLAVQWKKAYESELNAVQSTVVEDDEKRRKVDFDKDFGYLNVNGYTLTDPAYAWLSIKQSRPLELTVAATQSKDGSWNTYVTSSDENVEIDVRSSTVNPFMFERKWYEKLTLGIGMGLGSGLASHISMKYDFGKFSAGPTAYAVTANGSTDIFYGAAFSWRPF